MLTFKETQDLEIHTYKILSTGRHLHYQGFFVLQKDSMKGFFKWQTPEVNGKYRSFDTLSPFKDRHYIKPRTIVGSPSPLGFKELGVHLWFPGQDLLLQPSGLVSMIKGRAREEIQFQSAVQYQTPAWGSFIILLEILPLFMPSMAEVKYFYSLPSNCL